MDLKSWNYYLEELVGAVERRRPSDPSQDPQFIDVKSLIKQQKTLDPQLWDGEKLKPEIADRLIQIARKFFKSLDIGPDTLIKDITLTGSLSSYNWSDYSDVDLHILLDFNEFENPDLIKDLVRNAASNWNNKHDIKIKGYDVEMYIQDANEPHHSLGVFSLSNNRFLKTPQRFNKKIDSGAVKEKANDLMEKIDDIYDLYAEHNYDLAEKRADYIINKIRNYRKSGLEQDGPYAIENLVFKVLRRNGYLEKIINLRTNSYDKRMSINLNEAVGYGVGKATMSDLRSLPVKGGIVDAVDYAQLNHSKRSSAPKYIVIHHSTSSPAKTLNVWTPRGSRKASTHFEIDKDGTIYMYLDPTTQTAWHAVDNNRHSIGIDLVGNFVNDPMSETEAMSSAQFRSLQKLVSHLKQRFGIPDKVLDKPVNNKKISPNQIISNGYGVVGHGHMRSTDCPGNIPWHLLGLSSGSDIANTPDGEKGDIDLSSREDLYTKSIAKGSGGEYGLGKNKFLSRFSHLKGNLIPGIYPSFDAFYEALDKAFGNKASDLMPIHGRDYIFGPEHFAAALKLAQATEDENLKNILKSRSFKSSDAATKVALKKSIKENVGEENTSNILISGNSHAGNGGAFPAIDRYYKQLSKITGKNYNLIRIDAPQGKGGEVPSLIRKTGNVISDLSRKGGKPTVDTIIHFGTNRSSNISRLLKRYDVLSDNIIIIGTPEAKRTYEKHGARARWNDKLKYIVSRMGNDFTYYDTFGLTSQRDLKDNVHLKPYVYTRLFNKVASDLKIDQTGRPSSSGVVTPGGVTVNKVDKKGKSAGLPSDESLYTRSIAKGTSGGSFGIGRNKFLSKFDYLKNKFIPGIYKTFNEFYKDLDKTFGKRSRALLPVHGKDYIFGPEHFSAALKLAQAKKDKKMENLLTSRSFKKSDAATKSALKKSIRKSNTIFTSPEGQNADKYMVEADVLRAARDMGADRFTTKLLLKFLEIETGGNPKYTFYNPAIGRYKGNANRPARADGIRLIGPFQILQGGEDAYRRYGYDPAQFGDPYHQAGVVVNFINAMRKKVGNNPTRIYLTWNQGLGGANAIYKALRTNPDEPVDTNPSIPPAIARNMKNNYAGSKPLTPRNFIIRYKSAKGLG